MSNFIAEKETKNKASALLDDKRGPQHGHENQPYFVLHPGGGGGHKVPLLLNSERIKAMATKARE